MEKEITSEEVKLEEARKLLQEEENKKKQACAQEVEVVLIKYGYILNVESKIILLNKQINGCK